MGMKFCSFWIDALSFFFEDYEFELVLESWGLKFRENSTFTGYKVLSLFSLLELLFSILPLFSIFNSFSFALLLLLLVSPFLLLELGLNSETYMDLLEGSLFERTGLTIPTVWLRGGLT